MTTSLICIFSISTLIIATFFYVSLLVPGHTSAGFKALGFSGDFLPKFQVRSSICCLGDAVYLLRWFLPAPSTAGVVQWCGEPFPTWHSRRLKQPQSQPAGSSSKDSAPLSSPGSPRGHSRVFPRGQPITP